MPLPQTLNSVAKLPQVRCSAGTLLNQRFNPSCFSRIDHLKKIAALVKTYFSQGGMHIQFNVVSADTLRDAQAHPEKYSDLLIRVAGSSALFINLDRAVQDEIIARTEQNLFAF